MKKSDYSHRSRGDWLVLCCLLAMVLCGCPKTQSELSPVSPEHQDADVEEPTPSPSHASIRTIARPIPTPVVERSATPPANPKKDSPQSNTSSDKPTESSTSAVSSNGSPSESPENVDERNVKAPVNATTPQTIQKTSVADRAMQERREKQAALDQLIRDIAAAQKDIEEQIKQARQSCNASTAASKRSSEEVEKMVVARKAIDKQKARSASESVVQQAQAARAHEKLSRQQLRLAHTQAMKLEPKIQRTLELAKDIDRESEIRPIKQQQNSLQRSVTQATKEVEKAQSSLKPLVKHERSARVTATLLGFPAPGAPARATFVKSSASAAQDAVTIHHTPEVTRVPHMKSTPEGILKAKKGEVAPVTVLGNWTQIDQNTKADFLPGGYTNSTLVFRADGVLEVRRTWGQSIQKSYRMSYQWKENKSRLILGEKPKDRPSKDLLTAFRIDRLGVVGTQATMNFPARLNCITEASGLITLGEKRYRKQK